MKRQFDLAKVSYIIYINSSSSSNIISKKSIQLLIYYSLVKFWLPGIVTQLHVDFQKTFQINRCQYFDVNIGSISLLLLFVLLVDDFSMMLNNNWVYSKKSQYYFCQL